MTTPRRAAERTEAIEVVEAMQLHVETWIAEAEEHDKRSMVRVLKEQLEALRTAAAMLAEVEEMAEQMERVSTYMKNGAHWPRPDQLRFLDEWLPRLRPLPAPPAGEA